MASRNTVRRGGWSDVADRDLFPAEVRTGNVDAGRKVADQEKSGDEQDPHQRFRKFLARMQRQLLPYVPSPEALTPVLAAAVQAALQDPNIYGCTPQSILIALVKVAQTGLIIGQTCYLVPFKDRTTGKRVCTFVAHYKGLIQLAQDTGHVGAIYAHVVRQGETFEPELGDNPKIKHIPLWRGDYAKPIVAGYAVCFHPRGGKYTVVMSHREMDEIRQEYSHKWKKGDMPEWWAQKTLIRNLIMRFLPLGGRLALAARYDDDSVKPATWEDVKAEFGKPAGAHRAAVNASSAPALPAPSPVITNAEQGQKRPVHRLAKSSSRKAPQSDPFAEANDFGGGRLW